MIKQLGGTFGNYQYLFLPHGEVTREITQSKASGNGGKRNPDMVLSAKMYQDRSCRLVREMGVERCTLCPLPSCNVSDSEASGWMPKDKKV